MRSELRLLRLAVRTELDRAGRDAEAALRELSFEVLSKTVS